MVGIAQLVRAPDCDSGGRRFKSGCPPFHDPLSGFLTAGFFVSGRGPPGAPCASESGILKHRGTEDTEKFQGARSFSVLSVSLCFTKCTATLSRPRYRDDRLLGFGSYRRSPRIAIYLGAALAAYSALMWRIRSRSDGR